MRLEKMSGTVQEVIHGRDHLVRAAIVGLISKGEETEIKRPVLRLYPVEVSNEQHDGGHKEVAGSAQSAVRFVPDDQVEIVCSQRIMSLKIELCHSWVYPEVLN